MANCQRPILTSDEITSGTKVAIVGSVIVEELFNGRAGVGETFESAAFPSPLIGVLDRKGLGAAGRSQDDVVFIPLSAAKSRVLGAVRGTTREALDFISIKVSDASAMPEIERELEALLRQRHRIRGDDPAISGSRIQRMSCLHAGPPYGSSAVC